MNMVQGKNWWKRIEEEMRRVHRCRMKAVLTLWGIGLLLGLGGCAEQTQDAAGEEQDNGADTAEHGTDAARQRTDWSGNRTNGTGQRADRDGNGTSGTEQ